MVESSHSTGSNATRPGNPLRNPPSRCLSRCWTILISLLALGFETVALSGEGYQPIRSEQGFPRDEEPEVGGRREVPRTRLDPPARGYAPYRQRRQPAASEEAVQDLIVPLPSGRSPEEPGRRGWSNAEQESVGADDSKWRAAPSRQNRLSPQTDHAPVTEEEADSTANLVADDGGPIAELLLHYALNSEGELGTVYQDLFQHLGPNVRLQVCCSNEASVDAFSSRWGTAAVGQGRQVQVVNVNRPITVWARDRRICRQTADGRPAACFVPTAHFTYDPEKQNDLVLSSLLFPTGLVPGVALSSFHLEGGNVVSNRRHVFVGANAFDDNVHRFVSESAMFGELSKIFGRPTIAIKGRDGEVPWIHTDMYLTPIDSRTILVSSPAEGCRLLEGQNSITVPHRDRQAQVVFDVVAADSPRQERFDEVANQLTGMGYQVIRVPALINVQKDWMVTYNNVLMDYQDGQRIVLMPVYHIPELDHAAAQIYRALGFEVRPVDVSTVFQLGGAIRCLANVTQRLPFETRLQAQDTLAPGRLQVYSVDPHANRMRDSRPRPVPRRPLPPSLRERPQASIERPNDLAQ